MINRLGPSRPPFAPAGLAVVLALALLAAASPAGAAKKKGAVKLEVVTATQAELLSSGALTVSVRGAKAKLTLTARQGESDLVDATAARSRRKLRTVVLPLTPRGRDLVNVCGPQSITVEAAYRQKGKGKGKGKAKRRVARATAELAAASSGCRIKVDAPNAGRCDPIDLAHCLAPYPNDYFTRADPSTDTGLRVNIDPASAPQNLNGLSSFHPEFNRNDGFSPNNIILARVPGIGTPEAFKENGLVPQMEIGAYADPDQRVVLINADSGERHPIWAELDMVPGAPGDRLLLIHPAVALDYGARYIVALRGLTNEAGAPLQPNAVFGAYRDNLPTDNAAVEARRAEMESLFAELGDADIARQSLYLAWDFTVASERNLTERLLAMRDDAFAELGDTDLADGEVAGGAPEITITGETEYQLCDATAPADVCELNSPTPESNYAFKKVTGTVEVPCYMNAPGATYNPGQPNVPCAPGSRLHYEPGEEVPSRNGAVTWDAPFTCIVPRTAAGAGAPASGKPGILFGHGLLQNNRVVEQLGLFPSSLEGVACGTDWIGLSAVDPITGELLPQGDLLGYMFNMILVKRDLSLFSALPDRSQQGYVNALYLARAMAHEDGLCAKPEFDIGGDCALDIDPADTAADLGYYGVSLGGIFGGATTSVAPDWERAMLSVPGIGFTTLIGRSTQFNQFLPFISSAYPEPLPRQIGIAMLQLVWDRGEPSSYVHRMTDEPFPNTPAHQVMIHEAFGDHQVANVQTETLARSLGAAVREPTVAPGRLDDRTYLFSDAVDPFFTPDQEPIDSGDLNVPGGYTGAPATMFTLDTGPISGAPPFVGTNPNPDWNIAPVGRDGPNPNDGLDPHEPAATSPKAQQLAIPFLLGEGVYDSCVDGAPGPLVMPPWTVPYTGLPEPCTAPPVHSPGQGQ